MPSTAIAFMHYDDQTRTLSVGFVTNGRRYAYFDVPAEVYEAFRSSGSKGIFFNQRIRDRYRFELTYDPARDG